MFWCLFACFLWGCFTLSGIFAIFHVCVVYSIQLVFTMEESRVTFFTMGKKQGDIFLLWVKNRVKMAYTELSLGLTVSAFLNKCGDYLCLLVSTTITG